MDEEKRFDVNPGRDVLVGDVKTFLVTKIRNEMLSILNKKVNRFKKPIGNDDLSRVITKFTKSFKVQVKKIIPECSDLLEGSLQGFEDQFFLDDTNKNR